MSRSLEGKLAIITGGSRGIGAGIAENLAAKGANLVIGYTSSSSTEAANELASRLSSTHNIRVVPIQAELSDSSGPEQLIDQAKQAFAPDGSKFQIDIIVNNAGIARNAPIQEIKPTDFNATYTVNVLAPLLLIQSSLPYLPQSSTRLPTGRIINISSVSSSTGFVGQSIYGGTKAALEAMTRTWARELAHSCTVNAINPGPVEGPMYASNSPEFLEGIKGWIAHTPLMKPREGVDSPEVVESGERLAQTKEIAGVVGMLCGDDAGYVTGQVVCANGGMVLLH
ncbi:hypothetical protein OQA88_13563 [Cercophora sp. LCS_1]